jgi:hypothetical protein
MNSPCAASSQSPLSSVSAYSENCARSLAPPFQIEPALPGFDLVRDTQNACDTAPAAVGQKAASIVFTYSKRNLVEPGGKP